MPVQKTMPYSYGTFFITITCYKWFKLIEKANGYVAIYNWYNVLKQSGHYIIGYVIMPNHLHVLISFKPTGQSINTIVGNGKRFMAYDIVKGLKTNKENELLQLLSESIETVRKNNNKLHNVWEISFDWKYCYNEKLIVQKLNYMHNNPAKGKWQLAEDVTDYKHSSAKYYIKGEHSIYEVTNYMELNDIDLSS
jgi:REP element-mobilizing transposase RayT